MQRRLIDNLLLYILFLKQQLKRISIFWILLLPFQTFYIMLMSIQINLREDSQNYITSSLHNIYQQINSNTAATFIIILSACLTILLFSFALLFVIFKKPIHKLDPYHEHMRRLVTFSSFFMMVLQAILFPLCIYIKHAIIYLFSLNSKLNYIQERPNYLLWICVTSIIVVVVVFNYRIRVMGRLFIIYFIFNNLIVGLTLFNSVIGVFVCAFVIHTDEDHEFLLIKQRNLRKILHLVLLFFFVWNFINSLDGLSSQPFQSSLPYIYFLVYLLTSVTIGIVGFNCKIDKKLSPVLQLCQCLNKLKNGEADNFMKMKALQIRHQFSKDCQRQRIQKNIEKEDSQIMNWQSQQWTELIKNMIENQQQRKNCLSTHISMIKCRLIRPNKNVFEIIQAFTDMVLQQKQKSIRIRYQILKLGLKIRKFYSKKDQSEEIPVVQILRQVDSLNQMFFMEASKLIRNIYSFWATVLQNKMLSSNYSQQNSSEQINLRADQSMDAHKIIISIRKQLQKLQKIVINIQKLSVAQKQNNLLKSLKAVCIGSNDNKKMQYSGIDSFNQGILNTKKDYFQFIQIKDNKISEISLKLVSQLGFNKLSIIGESLNSIIPKQYESKIFEAIKNMEKCVNYFNFIIPLKCFDGTIVLKRLSLHLEVDFQSGYRFLLHFFSNLKNSDSFIIYNAQTNILEYSNKAFLNLYRSQHKSQKNRKIKFEALNPSEIFSDLDLNDKNIQAKLCESGTDAVYNCKMQTLRNSGSAINVRISLVEKTDNYFILRVVKGHRVKSLVGSATHCRQPSQESSLVSFTKFSARKMKQRICQDNAVYCKIQNPYEQKISRKKKQILEGSKFSLKLLAVASVFFAILLYISQSFCFLLVSFDINDKVQQDHLNILSQFEEYTMLMQAYQSYFQQTIVYSEKQTIISQGLNYSRILESNRKKIQTNINDFQKKYLQNLQTPTKNPITYTIQFKNFNITTDTSKTTLFDFSQNLLQYENSQSLKFLVNNYRTFGNLVVKTCEFKGSSDQNTIQSMNLFYTLSCVLFGIMIIAVILSILLKKKVQRVCSSIEHIFYFIELRDLEKLFKQISYLNQKVLENKEQQKIEFKAYQHAVKSRQLLQRYMQIIDSVIQATEQDQQAHLMINQEQMSTQTKQENEHSYNSLQKNKKNYMFFYSLLFIISMGIIFMIQSLYMQSSTLNESMTLQYVLQNRKMTQNVIHQVLEAQFSITSTNLFNNSGSANFSLFSNKLTINDKKLPQQYFKQFLKNSFEKNSGNLCQTLKNKTAITFSPQTCSIVGGGIFKYGISKTTEYLNHVLVLAINQSSWMGPSPFSKLISRSQQIVYSQQMILAINKENFEEFKKYYDDFNNKIKQNAIELLLLGCGFTLMLFIINICIKRNVYEIAQVAIGYFLIMPQKVLLQYEVLDHIRKNDILNRISSI